jgi:hypothetical protein
MLRLIAFAAFALGAACAAAQTPLRADVRDGRICRALAPPDWSFTGENPAGSALSADIQRVDYTTGRPAGRLLAPGHADRGEGAVDAAFGSSRFEACDSRINVAYDRSYCLREAQVVIPKRFP